MRAIGSSGQGAEAKYLLKALGDAKGDGADLDPQVRRDAAQGLSTTWDVACDPVLALRVRQDEDDQVRIFCAKALVRTNSPEGLRALIDAMADKNAAVVRYAHNSLAVAARQDFGFDTKAWAAWYQKTYVAPAASGPATRP